MSGIIWSNYNKGLKSRYDLNLWFPEDIEKIWLFDERKRRPGGKSVYSDDAIRIMLQFSYLFNIPLRGVEGFFRSLFRMNEIALPVPDYTRLSRRQKDLDVKLSRPNKKPKGRFLDIVIDSSGLKVYGEGEWKVKKHGREKHRIWRKLHLSSDAETMEILECELTDNKTSDGEIMPNLLPEKSEDFGEDINKKAFADGAYDWHELHRKSDDLGIELIIPPRKGAVVSVPEDDPGILTRRDRFVIDIEQSSMKEWKQNIGYHIRSLSETQFYRWKQILSEKLRSRNFQNQKVEARIKANILNIMAQIATPKTT